MMIKVNAKRTLGGFVSPMYIDESWIAYIDPTTVTIGLKDGKTIEVTEKEIERLTDRFAKPYTWVRI